MCVGEFLNREKSGLVLCAPRHPGYGSEVLQLSNVFAIIRQRSTQKLECHEAFLAKLMEFDEILAIRSKMHSSHVSQKVKGL